MAVGKGKGQIFNREYRKKTIFDISAIDNWIWMRFGGLGIGRCGWYLGFEILPERVVSRVRFLIENIKKKTMIFDISAVSGWIWMGF